MFRMPASTADVYAIVPDADALPVAMATCERVARAGLSVLMHAARREGLGSMKSQFKKAERQRRALRADLRRRRARAWRSRG